MLEVKHTAVELVLQDIAKNGITAPKDEDFYLAIESVAQSLKQLTLPIRQRPRSLFLKKFALAVKHRGIHDDSGARRVTHVAEKFDLDNKARSIPSEFKALLSSALSQSW